MAATSIDTMAVNTMSEPLTMLQQTMLKHMMGLLSHHYLRGYDGVTIIFQDFIFERVNDMQQLDILLKKGGNAFFNHMMFSLFYGNAWRFVPEWEDARRYSRNFDDARGIQMTSILMTFAYRMLFRHIVVRTRDHAVIIRGKSWYTDPKQCLRDGITWIENNPPQDRNADRAIVMLESHCTCMVHSPALVSSSPCRCTKDITAFVSRAGE